MEERTVFMQMYLECERKERERIEERERTRDERMAETMRELFEMAAEVVYG